MNVNNPEKSTELREFLKLHSVLKFITSVERGGEILTAEDPSSVVPPRDIGSWFSADNALHQ